MRPGALQRPPRPVSPSCVPPQIPRTQAAPAAAAGARESCLTPGNTVGVPEDTVGCRGSAVTQGRSPPGCIGSQALLSGDAGWVVTRTTPASSPTVVTTLIFRDFPRPGRLTLPDPAHQGFGLQARRRLVLAVAPRTASAGTMFLPTAA